MVRLCTNLQHTACPGGERGADMEERVLMSNVCHSVARRASLARALLRVVHAVPHQVYRHQQLCERFVAPYYGIQVVIIVATILLAIDSNGS